MKRFESFRGLNRFAPFKTYANDGLPRFQPFQWLNLPVAGWTAERDHKNEKLLVKRLIQH